MFYNSAENELMYNDNIREDFVERVYVDWPELNNDEFRFISSRMEDIEDDNVPLVFQPNGQNRQSRSFNIDQLKFDEKTPINNRYERISKRKTHKNLKDSSIPPLDLISQNSSIDIGTKGVIDIDLRSSSESLSEGSQGSVVENLERDSLDTQHNNSSDHKGNHNHPNFYNTFLNTTLPEVKRSDLVINHKEFDSSRYNHSNSNSTRKLSEISVLSQYRTELLNSEKNIGKLIELPNPRLENEKAAFEAARRKYKQPTRISSHNSKLSQKSDSTAGSQSHKLVKTKPTLLVAPQIKQPLHNVNSVEKATNFVEFNKIPSNVQKQAVQSSYASKYIDRHKKEPSSAALKNSPSHKDHSQFQNNFTERYHNEQNLEFQDEESIHKKFGISTENLSNDNFHGIHISERPYQITNPNGPYPAVQDATKLMNTSNFLCAYNQYGDPILISAETIIPAYTGDSRFPNSAFNVIQYQNNVNYDSKKSSPSFPCSPQTSRKLQNTNHEISKSVEFDFILKDAAFKRQPTLYDENLLMKKLKQIKTNGTGIKFPPIPNFPHSSDSSINLSANSGYAANHRRKESNYEQYTLRDFRNLKQIDRAGGLGPNIGTDSYKQMKEKLIRQKNYAEAVQEKNRQKLIRQSDKVVEDKPTHLEDGIEPFSTVNDNDTTKIDEDKIKVNQEVSKNSDKLKEKQMDSPKMENKGNANKKSVPFSNKEQINKRDAMLLYAKAVKEKQIKKRDSKPQMTKAQSAGTYKEVERNAIHELFSNSDLDRLVLRHENDKKMVEQISQKLGKIS